MTKTDDKKIDGVKTYHFQRIEVKTGASQLGFVQVTPLQAVKMDKNIVVKGAFYLQAHLQITEGGGDDDH